MTDWKETTFGECADLIRNMCHPSGIEETAYIGLEHIEQGTLQLSGLGRSSDVDSQKFQFVKNDILFGKLRPYFRKVVVAPGDGICSTDIWVVRAKQEVNQKYLYYLMASKEFVDFSMQGSQGTRMPRAKWEHVSRYKMMLPTLTEQQTIAEILGSLDDKIELNRQMNETLEGIARALFKSWFVDFRFPGYEKAKFVDSELSKVPKGWDVKNIGDICEVKRGGSPRPIHNYMDGEIPWLKIADATASNGPFIRRTKQKLKKEGVCKSVEVHPGDLILSNSATCGVPIYVDIYGCIHDGWLYFKGLTSISKGYLYHYLHVIAEHLINIADGSVQKNLNTTLVASQQVLTPPAEIMKKFDLINDNIFEKIKNNIYEMESLARMRDTLLPKLLSGELKVGEL